MIKTIEELKKDLMKLHFFGECQLRVSEDEEYKQYEVEVIDYEVYDIYNSAGEMIHENEESSSLKYKLFVDYDGIISVIEHGYGIFTKVNAKEVSYVVSFIGLQLDIEDLQKNLTKE